MVASEEQNKSDRTQKQNKRLITRTKPGFTMAKYSDASLRFSILRRILDIFFRELISLTLL